MAPKDSATYCRAHRDAATIAQLARVARLMAAERCVNGCTAPLKTRRHCAACAENHVDDMRRYRDGRMAEGKCVVGGCAHPPVLPARRCAVHGAMLAANSKARRARLKAALSAAVGNEP